MTELIKSILWGICFEEVERREKKRVNCHRFNVLAELFEVDDVAIYMIDFLDMNSLISLLLTCKKTNRLVRAGQAFRELEEFKKLKFEDPSKSPVYDMTEEYSHAFKCIFLCKDKDNRFDLFRSRLNHVQDIKMAKWIYSFGQIDFKAKDDRYFVPCRGVFDEPGKNAFELCCYHGNFAATQWIYQFIKDDITSEEIDSIFFWSVNRIGLDHAKWLYERTSSSLNMHEDDDYMFRKVIRDGDLKVIQWLFELGCTLDDKAWEFELEMTCVHGKLDKFKWILSVHPYDIHSYDGYLFIKCCKNGNIQIAQHIYSDFQDFYDLEFAFQVVCRHEYFDMAEWILSLHPYLSRTKMSRFFALMCWQSKLESAKWVYERIWIDIWEDGGSCFKQEITHKNYETMEWLLSLKESYEYPYPMTSTYIRLLRVNLAVFRFRRKYSFLPLPRPMVCTLFCGV